MVIKNVGRGIGLVLVIMSFVLAAMAAIPVLENGGISPSSGDTSTTFTFNVTFKDSLNRSADYVNLNLDNFTYSMSASDPTDVNTTDGKSYYYSIGSLSNATHYYNFTAKNGSDAAVPTGDASFIVSAITPSAPSITGYLPASTTVNSFVNGTQYFNVTVNQDANVSWKIDGVEVQLNSSVPAGVMAMYSNNTITAGTYTVTATASNAYGASSPITWTWIVRQPNTPTGTNVSVTLTSNLKVTFSTVTTEGNTSVSESSSLPGGTLPHAFQRVGNYYDISTTALYGGDITVELNYGSPGVINESNIKFYHWVSSWVEEPSSLDTAGNKVTGTLTGFSPVVAGAEPAPLITYKDPDVSSLETIGSATQTFKIKVNQDANVTWYLDSSPLNSTYVLKDAQLEYTPTTPSMGTHTFKAIAQNINGTGNATWNWTVRSKTYATGNRVWDSSKDMSLTYTWSPMSFYAFYYDVNDNVGNESLQINLAGSAGSPSRAVARDQLIYTTGVENVSFQYKGWGGYDVIGFMADKYFARYTGATSNSLTKGNPVSPIGYAQLHKILLDDKDSHTIRTSTTYALADGYAVTLKDIGTGRLAWISILKDGGEVYSDFASEGGTLVYSKKVGSVSDLPLIAIHIKSVFMGSTENAVFIDGIFQISESFTSANSGNRYGIMEITDTSETRITMKNRNSFSLSSGSTIDIMGDMKFIVAKNDAVLRFAPMIKRSGEYEVRGTISNNEDYSEWTPLNFEGFYYNIDEDVGTEKLSVTRLTGSRTIAKDALEYNTTVQQVTLKYKGMGRYNVLGFMAGKYFAGYVAGAISQDGLSTIEHNQLHEVLIDDDTQRIIYAGSTLTLQEGYVIKIKDVNMGAGTASVWLTVLKDGTEVYDDFKEAGQIFKYEKDSGSVKDLPIIALRIDNIFRGTEATAAFVKGTFQISESYTSVNNGDRFDKMEVTEVSKTGVKMTNPATITLSSASTVDVMKNIKFKVADSSDIRYYPYIMVNGSALAANQLAIGVPSSLMVKDTISISVTSGSGTPQNNAEVSFDGSVIGTTNSTGKLDYMLTKAGQHNFTATKLGYEKATKAVQIAEYVDNRLNFEMPEFIDQYIPVAIKVKVSGSGNYISGANITLDGTSIGKTDTSGTLSYTFMSSGKHNLEASKPGYTSIRREIDVRMPFTEFKALDINFRPDVVNKGQSVYVWSNITNSGTKEGTLPVALIINATVVENSNVTLAPGKYGVVNFTRKIELAPGNYTVEILGQKTTMPVREEPLNLFLVVGAITGLGIIVVYFLTSQNLMSVEAIKSKLNMETVNRAVANAKSGLGSLSSKFMKKGGKGGAETPKYDPFSRFEKK